MEWALQLWNEKRWLFWLLIPVVLLWVFKDLIFKLLAGSAHAEVQKAEAKDRDLNAVSVEAEKKSAVAEAKADQLETKIQDRKTDDVSEDWHLHYKKKDQ